VTKGQLLSILYERLNFAASPATDVTTRLGNALNEGHRMILREPGLQRLRDIPANLTFASVASLGYYGLPPVLSDIRAITDRTNDRRLRVLSWTELRAGDPGLDATGTPYGYLYVGIRQIKRLPAGTGLWAVSSSAGDTTQTIMANGIRTAGDPTGDQTATLNGATRAQIGTLTDYVDVLQISLSAVGAGVVDLYDAAAAGNLLASIPVGALHPQYLGVILYPTPTDAITYYADGPARILDMDDAQDVPMLPEEFHDLLVHAALLIEYQKRDDPRRQAALEHYKRGLSSLKHHLAAGPDDLPVMGRPNTVRSSRLGPWFPAD
jgi:hypothetical protein